MAHPAGESESNALRLDFDRRLMPQLRGFVLPSDAGLLAYREPTTSSALPRWQLKELRRRAHRQERPPCVGRFDAAGLLRQSVFGRLASYEDVNDAERPRHEPTMRWIIGGNVTRGSAASPSQIGRFEMQWLAASMNLSALADLSGQWIDLVRDRRPPRGIVLDTDSSVIPTHGEQEMSVWNGYYACTCYHPLFVFNQFGDPRTQCASSGQRAQCGRLGQYTQSGGCASSGQGLVHLFPGRRIVRAAQGDGSRLNRVSVLQDGRKNANITPV